MTGGKEHWWILDGEWRNLPLAGKTASIQDGYRSFFVVTGMHFFLVPEKDSRRCKMLNFDSPLRGRFGSLGMVALVILLLGMSAYSLTGLVDERRHTQELTASNEFLVESVRHLQNQLQSVSEKLNATAVQLAVPLPASRDLERPSLRAASSRKASS
jgi:hypothetical protein